MNYVAIFQNYINSVPLYLFWAKKCMSFIEDYVSIQIDTNNCQLLQMNKGTLQKSSSYKSYQTHL